MSLTSCLALTVFFSIFESTRFGLGRETRGLFFLQITGFRGFLAGMHSISTYTVVGEPLLNHFRGIVKISPIKNYRLHHERLHFFKVRVPELVPLRDYDKRICALD